VKSVMNCDYFEANNCLKIVNLTLAEDYNG
jgi:hypothetical protein